MALPMNLSEVENLSWSLSPHRKQILKISKEHFFSSFFSNYLIRLWKAGFSRQPAIRKWRTSQRQEEMSPQWGENKLARLRSNWLRSDPFLWFRQADFRKRACYFGKSPSRGKVGGGGGGGGETIHFSFILKICWHWLKADANGQHLHIPCPPHLPPQVCWVPSGQERVPLDCRYHTAAQPSPANMQLTGKSKSLMGPGCQPTSKRFQLLPLCNKLLSPNIIHTFRVQSSLWYWWLSHFVAFLARVPWPGCSLIYNQNIKSLVSPSREAVANWIKPTLSLGWRNYLVRHRQFKDAQVKGYVCPHAHTHTELRYFTRCFWYSWQGGKIKMLILPQKWTWRFFPFQHQITPYLLNLSRKSWYLWQEDRWARRDIPRAIRQSTRMLGRALLLLFKSDTHQDNSLSRPCLLCRKPHSKHGLVCGREAAYRPTLFMLQVGLTEKPHQFVLK